MAGGSTVQVRQLLELVPRWVDVDAEDALEMLGASYMYGPIRALAVRSLAPLPDGELAHVLMPLAMALRYDLPQEPHLASLLIKRALRNTDLAVALYWYTPQPSTINPKP
jgi:phosphatidylinositol 3-kinase